MSEFRDFLSDMLFIIGLVLIPLSTIQPFFTVLYMLPPDPYFSARFVEFLRADYFSFKVDYSARVYGRSESWGAYWFNQYDWLHVNSSIAVSYLLIVVFSFQILALVLGLTTIPLKPRTRIIPLILGAVTTFLMTLIYFSLRASYFVMGLLVRTRYEWVLADGYWLIFASVVCMSISLILARKRQSRLLFSR